jgi:hypothetical protein
MDRLKTTNYHHNKTYMATNMYDFYDRGTDDQRVKSIIVQTSGTLTRYYMGNYEEEIRNGNTKKIHYIKGVNGLSAISFWKLL